MALGKRWLVALFVVFLVSCVTVNIYFPAAAIQKAADEIVDDVRKAPPGNGGEKSGTTSRLARVRLVDLGLRPAQARQLGRLDLAEPCDGLHDQAQRHEGPRDPADHLEQAEDEGAVVGRHERVLDAVQGREVVVEAGARGRERVAAAEGSLE